MTIEFGISNGTIDTKYAPLAALCYYYRQSDRLEALEQVQIPVKNRCFSAASKLIQVMLSILAGCETLSEVNTKLKPETGLASISGWDRFADQSSLSRTLDALTLMNIEQMRRATTSIWRTHSQAMQHDWRGFLWLDFDLSGLPCSIQAQASQKGYFSGEKTQLDANWHGSVRSNTVKPSGRSCTPETVIRSTACAPP